MGKGREGEHLHSLRHQLSANKTKHTNDRHFSTKMPPKRTEPAVASLTSQMDAMSMTAKDDFILKGAHPRPDYGKAGQPVKAEANLYQVRLSSKVPGAGTVFHYDLNIARVVKTPSDKMPKNLTEKIWAAACHQEAGAPDKLAFETSAFDLGKNVYTVHQFKADSNGRQLVVGVPEEGRELDDRSRFKLTLKLANTIDLQSIMDFCSKNEQTLQIANTVLTAIQAGNILFRDDPCKKFHPMGARGKFFTMDGAVPISGGAVVAMGFYQQVSFRPTSSNAPAIQLNSAFTAMFKPGNLLDLLPQLAGMGGGGGFGGRGGRGGPRGGRGGGQMGGFGGHATIDQLNNFQIRSLSKLLWGAKFTLPYKKTSRFFTIKQISQAAAADIRFVMQGRDGAPSKDISIVNYFKEQFNITIRKPRLPCVVYGKNFMVPIELVHLAEFNAVPFAQLTGDQAAEMIKIAAQRPPDRSAAIKTWRARLNYQGITKIRQWGIEVAPNMMQVEGRVLHPPRVMYKGNKELGAIEGGWNLKGVSFTRPGTPLKAWGVVSLHKRVDVQVTSNFINYLVRSLKQYGVNVANPTPDIMCPAQTGSQHLHNNIRLMCQTLATKHKIAPQLIIVILGGKDTATYQQIKNIAGMQLKMMFPTQCLLGQKILQDRSLDQYCGNVAMKIQAKLGGVTHEVPMTEVTTIMIGADVTHPPPAGGGLLQPSIAVTVAGTDGENVRFSVCARLQEGRVEIISDLANMVREHIERFQKKAGIKPDRILFFRDGVSEGQYMAVTKMEVEAVKKAAASFGDPKYRPKITFVVCAKRHNMRFFSMSQKDQDRTGNLKAGFVVDQRVTHPFAFDFYLQAHAGLQGTARPTHYIVLIDENGFNADKMQNLCNRLCYTYARATRAVSIVPVAYYADIIANQCRFLAYTDDSQEGSHSGPPKTRNYDPLAVAKRIQAVADVAWYM
ncbi:hypothetical protein CcaverHIS002_0406790 [Cutaneotrichosporon cavernicola]|nr:hypothetical protein CcaverHIS002_0406790 [Cutaneotrichosporon cavernicola]